MIKRGLVVVVIMTTVLASSAVSQDNQREDVQELLRLCESGEVSELRRCLDIVASTKMIMAFNCYSNSEQYTPNPMFTMDGRQSNGAAIQAFKNWAKTNPTLWDTGYILGLAFSLSLTFPCERL